MPCMPARRKLHTGRHNFLHRSWGPFEPFDDSTFTILKENGVYTHLVPCPASFWCFRVRHARQCKAWSAGNIGHIGKDHNAAVARMANSRRARPTGPVARCAPWQWVHHCRRGRALPQTRWDALKYQKLAEHDTGLRPLSLLGGWRRHLPPPLFELGERARSGGRRLEGRGGGPGDSRAPRPHRAPGLDQPKVHARGEAHAPGADLRRRSRIPGNQPRPGQLVPADRDLRPA